MSKRIGKVKFNGLQVEIHSEESQPGQFTKESVFKSMEKPHPDFGLAFDALVPVAYEILELPRDWKVGSMSITGVSFSCSEGTEIEGAVISGRISLETAQGPFNFNTPHIPFSPYSEGSEAPCLSMEQIDALEKVRKEAAAFMNDGKRSQGELKLEEQPDGKAAAAGSAS